MYKVDYDDEWDVLYVHKGEKVKFSVEAFGNFVMDIGFDGKVVALEILDASKELKVPKKDLAGVQSVKMASLMKDRAYGVAFSLKLAGRTIESELRVPKFQN